MGEKEKGKEVSRGEMLNGVCVCVESVQVRGQCV